jgi:hypothetical protein
MTKKTYIHPISKGLCSKACLSVGLKDAEDSYMTKKTGMGKVAAIAVIAAYKKALGFPLPELKYEGRKLDLSTVTLDDKGNPSFQMPQPERDHWTDIDASLNNVAYLQYKGFCKVNLSRRLDGDGPQNPALTDREWRQWLDLMSAAPNLIRLAKDIKDWLTPETIANMPIRSQKIATSILNMAEFCIDKSKESMKD